MANRVVLNCRKVSRRVTYTVTGTAAGRAMIVVDDDNTNNNDDHDELLKDDDGVITKDVGGRKEGLSPVSEEEEGGEGVSRLGIPTLAF
jgi:hypothetical protein